MIGNCLDLWHGKASPLHAQSIRNDQGDSSFLDLCRQPSTCESNNIGYFAPLKSADAATKER